jgi:acetyl esterase/lipase
MANSMWVLETPSPQADYRIAYGANPLQFGDLRLPPNVEGKIPVVVNIHGGFWRNRYNLEHAGHLCAALTAMGMATWNIEYRRIGDEGGAYPGTFLDVATAIDFLPQIAAQYKLDLARVVVMGHSAGGHLAAWVAGRKRIPQTSPLFDPNPLPIKAAISLAGVVDLHQCWEMKLSNNVVEDLLGGSPETVPERYNEASPMALLPVATPLVLIHGTADENVPYSLSEDYFQKAKELGDPVGLVTLPDAAHFEVIDPKSAEWEAVKTALISLL